MSRYEMAVRTEHDRSRVRRFIDTMPLGVRVHVKGERRSLPQNSKLWACLTDVATQLPWHGKKRTPDQWKLLFLDSLNHELKLEMEVVPSLHGQGEVNIGRSSSDLSKSEMSLLIELIHAFGAEHGVKFHDTAEAA